MFVFKKSYSFFIVIYKTQIQGRIEHKSSLQFLIEFDAMILIFATECPLEKKTTYLAYQEFSLNVKCHFR